MGNGVIILQDGAGMIVLQIRWYTSPMIALGQEQHLGRRTFMLLLSRKAATGIVLLAAALFLLVLQSSLALGIAGAMSLGGPISRSLADNISGGISYIGLLVFLVGIIAFLIGFIVTLLEYRNYTFTLSLMIAIGPE